MEFLEKRFPHLVARLSGVASASGAASELSARSKDWDGLLDRWLRAASLKKDTAYALSGTGDGRIVEKVLESLPEGSLLFCGESDLGIAKAFLESVEGRRALEDERFYLGAGLLDEGYFASLSQFPVLDIENAEPLVFAPFYEERPDYYGEFFSEFARGVDYWRKLRGTNVVYSGDWQSNTLRNLSRMLGCPDLRELKGRFEGRTMVLVSAGPSLDEALPFVKAACEDALVVAVNSSYRALRNAGMAPHFVMAADPYEHTAKGFEGVETEGTILVAPFIVYPKVSELFEGRTVTWSENNVLATSFREALGLGVGSRVVEQGTVSACGFDLAKVLGCRRILMVGQDLAAREDGQTHATDSFYTGEGLNFTDVQACRWMPGNTIEKVPVESKLYVYLKTFEQLAGSYGEDLELVNTSRLGARIEGIPYEPAEAAFGRLGNERYEWDLGERFEEVFEDVSKRRVESEPIRDEMKRLSAYLKGVSSTALSIALEIEIGGEGGFAEDSQLEELRRKEKQLDDLVQSDPRFEGILREGQLKLELARFKKEMRDLGEDLSERERSLERTKGLCWALAEGAFRLYRDSREGMGEGTHEEQALK